MKFLARLFFLSVCLQLLFFGVIKSQNLELVNKNTHDLRLEETKNGTYRLTTTGGDPYVTTSRLEKPLSPGQHVLAFEYFSATGLDELKLYFAPPVSEQNTRVLNDMNASEGWTTYSVDLKEQLKEWGEKGDFLRLDLGTFPDRTIQIRNLRFRKPTERELEIAARKKERKAFEARLNSNLNTYLQEKYPDKISEVEVASDEIIVRGKINSDRESLLLREVRFHEHVTELKAAGNNFKKIDQKGSFELTFSRFIEDDNRTYDRLLSKWVIGTQTPDGFELRSHASYPDKIASKWNLQEDTLRGRKGIGGFSAFRDAPVSDLDSLGISSVTVNIWITNWMRSEPSENTMAFTFNGKTYYVDRDQVEEMDRTLREASSRDIIVSAIILIGQAANTPDKKIGEIFEHPDSDPAGIYSMANVTSPKGIEYYAAIMDFLARRYNRPDEKYGRIHHWIVHNEVDAGWVWTNAGDKTPLVFMDLYHKSMRLIYNIARKYNPHTKAFISLTHYWNWTSDEKFYHSKDLLEILLDFSRTEGDFEWAIAHHPYPESLFEPKSWLDQKVDFTFDTPLITYKNIEVLDAWVRQPKTYYKGEERRTVFLSEQGLNSKDYSEKHLKEQAAGMAYAWKKIKPLEAIDAFQYHNWQDNRGEGGLRIGLRRFPDAEQKPGGKKPIWHVYKYLNTPEEDSAAAFAKDMIGIKSWDQVRYSGPVDPAKKDNTYRDVKSDTWVATDALGRSLPGFEEAGEPKEDKTVGIFYFLTHNSNGKEGPHNVTEILVDDPQNPKWGPGSHYWGEPETGYYLSTDEWMIRRHARMLSDAGVDVIIFDVTNNVTFPQVYMKIAEVFRTMRKKGEGTPQFAFLASEKSIYKLWDNFYSKGLYPDLWFRWDGKPLLMFGQWEIHGKMSEITFPKEIKDFFTIRESWAWTSLAWYEDGKHQWPWIDHFPQRVGWSDSSGHAEYVPVGVAQHPLSNIGRSFHNFHQPQKNKYDVTTSTEKGLFFREQWSRALEVEPEFVFITGWNEWSAGKQVMGDNIEESLLFWDFYPGAHLGKAGEPLQTGDSYFIDQYNQEYSRDIEPMKGGHTDNYYYQMIANIRLYKGIRKPEKAGSSKSIDLKGDFAQWDDVQPEFRDHRYDVSQRNSPGNYQSGPYINKTGRNDLMNMKVSRDEENIYFYASTRTTLTGQSDDNWMLLYIDADQNQETGWEGYDYLVNKKVLDDETTTLSRYDDGKWIPKEKISYHTDDHKLMLSIPRTYIGETGKVALDFHWADNIQQTDEITEFFLNGDHAPERRANYRYSE